MRWTTPPTWGASGLRTFAAVDAGHAKGAGLEREHAMIDYAESLERLGKALGEHYRQSGYILGVPGTSLALKVDPFYYLAIQPGFTKYLARWAGMFPDRAALALVKTGNMLSDASHTVYTTPVAISHGSEKVKNTSY